MPVIPFDARARCNQKACTPNGNASKVDLWSPLETASNYLLLTFRTDPRSCRPFTTLSSCWSDLRSDGRREAVIVSSGASAVCAGWQYSPWGLDSRGQAATGPLPLIFKFWNQKFCSWSLVKLCWAGAQSDQFVLDKIKIFNWCDTISICQPSSERALLLLNKGKFLTSKWQKSRRFANEFVYFKWSTGKISLKMRRICTKIIIWTCTARISNT